MARPAISSGTLLSRSLAVTVLENEGSHVAPDSVLERSHFNDALSYFGVSPSVLIFLSFFPSVKKEKRSFYFQRGTLKQKSVVFVIILSLFTVLLRFGMVGDLFS